MSDTSNDVKGTVYDQYDLESRGGASCNGKCRKCLGFKVSSAFCRRSSNGGCLVQIVAVKWQCHAFVCSGSHVRERDIKIKWIFIYFVVHLLFSSVRKGIK